MLELHKKEQFTNKFTNKYWEISSQLRRAPFTGFTDSNEISRHRFPG